MIQSPDFPPTHTVRTTFIIHGVPSSIHSTCDHYSVCHYNRHHRFDHYFSILIHLLIYFVRLSCKHIKLYSNHTRLNIFPSSLTSTHLCLPLGACSSPACRDCTCNTIRCFINPILTPPQHAILHFYKRTLEPFIHRFVSLN